MLYIHIPFCRSKCIYCNFYSGGNPDWEKYTKAVVHELSSRIDELKGNSLSSIYFGGGTPSLLPGKYLIRLVEEIKNHLRENDIMLEENIEFTFEVNPEDVSHHNIEIWKSVGINRISMGIQTLEDKELSLLHRSHSSSKALEAMNLLKEEFDNYSIDIIYGLPDQNIKTLEFTLSKILSNCPPHISVYSLTFENNTPLSVLKNQGKIKEKTEEDYLIMSRFIEKALIDKGYERYEISNYSLPNFRSRHNSGYWSGKPYLGLGPSASSFDGINKRRNNPADLKKYISFFHDVKNQRVNFYIEEILSLEEQLEEKLFLELRTSEGLDLYSLKNKFGSRVYECILQISGQWIATGHLKIEQDKMLLTSEGYEISDYIILNIVGKLL